MKVNRVTTRTPSLQSESVTNHSLIRRQVSLSLHLRQLPLKPRTNKQNFEIAVVQKDANLVDSELEKCCQTHILLQNFVLIQPRTSPPKICKIFEKCIFRKCIFRKCIFRNFCKFLAGSFSAVSKRNFARKYAFDSIFQALQDLHPFAPLQSQNFRKKSV